MAKVTSEFSGKEVDTYSEEWRFECECAHLLRMPSRDARNNFIEGNDFSKGIRKVRGDAAANALRAGVLLLWEIRQARK